jgi:hypothetical protein
MTKVDTALKQGFHGNDSHYYSLIVSVLRSRKAFLAMERSEFSGDTAASQPDPLRDA